MCAVLAVALASLCWCSSSVADETVQVCGSTYANNIFAASTVPAITATGRCPTAAYNGAGFGLFNNSNTTQGEAGRWQANTPAGLELVGATASEISSTGLNDGGDYGGGFYWAGGGVPTNNQTDQNPSVGMVFSSPSSYFGMQLVCGKRTCTQPAQLTVGAFSLYVRETVAPTLTAPIGLWASSGWVRGHWQVFGWGDSPSGLCSLSATLNGSLVGETTSPQDLASWHQCQAGPVDQAIDTSSYGQGAIPLTIHAVDAAGLTATVTKTVYVDNQQPTVTLTGPTDAPSTAGTQYVTATASAGPSGVAGISCAVDGGPAQWYVGSSAQIPVSGIGQHTVECTSENKAVGHNGNHGTSTPESFSLKIGAPTVTAIAFSKIVDRLSCHQAREMVKVPAGWVTVRRHGRRVRVRRPAHVKPVRVTKCHARTVQRRRTVLVTVLRHGRRVRVQRRKIVRVIVLPHALDRTSRRVAHGQATTVSGWLGTYTGVALGGQPVEILAAVDDGREQFSPVGVVTTAANGSWSAQLPAGPSRLVEAAYGGGPSVQPSLSGLVREIVPAEVKLLSVSPHRVAWGGTVRLVGQLKGGYLPSGGALVRLRIGLGSTFTTYGVHEHVGGNGRFSTSYTFGAGDPSALRSFWFQVASLPTGDYPYAPANSRRLPVLVGGHPPPPRRHTGR